MRLAAVLAAVLAAGCGVAVAPATAPPACGRQTGSDQLGAIHFLTRSVGLGLTLPTPHCGPMLAVSRDGGRRWLTEGTPLPGTGLVEQLVATSPDDAWASVGGGRLLATTDGGTTWVVQSPRWRVLALALAGRTPWMLKCLGGTSYGCVAVLLRKLPSDGAWTITGPKLLASPYPELLARDGRTTVLSGDGDILIVRNGGAAFAERPDPVWAGQPCQPAGLAAAGRSWWLLCLGGAAAGSSEKALIRTTDGGRTWTIASQVTSLTAPLQPGAITREEPSALAAASPTRLWLAALNSLYESADGGVRWSRAPGPDPQGTPTTFDVLSPTHAWLLAAGQGLWRTTDGRHWTALGPVAVSP